MSARYGSDRPTALALSGTTWALVLVLGFALGVLVTVNGYAVPAALVTLVCLGVVQLTEQQREQAAGRVRDALHHAKIGIRQAARIMEMDPSDLERGLSGERKLDLWRLEMLPDAFWQEYWPLLARDKGVPETFRTAIKSLPVWMTFDSERTA